MTRLLAIVLTLLVVLSAVPAGPVGSAAAVHTEDCTAWDGFAYWMTLSFTGINNPSCDPLHLPDSFDDMEDDMENATKTEIYNTGQQSKADTEQYLTVTDNYLDDSGTVAMSKAEAAAIEEIDAGGSRSEAKSAAVEAVEDYYTIKQMNLRDQWGVTVSTLGTMGRTAQVAPTNEDFVHLTTHNEGDSWNYAMPNGTGTETITTVNGTSINIQTLEYRAYSDYFGYDTNYISINETEPFVDVQENVESGANATGVTVNPTGSQTGYEAMNFTDYADSWRSIKDRSAQMEANAEAYAGSLYNASEDGELNASTYVSPSTQAQEYATDYNSTGYYAYAVAWGASAGFTTPDMNASALMTIQTGTGTYEGLIMSQTAPNNDTWEVGTTYDAATIQGKQFVATTGDEGVVELTGQFTITEMLDEDGEPVQNTTIQEIEYGVSTTAEDYAALQEDIRAIQQEIHEEEEAGLPGSGSGGSGLGDMGWIALGIVVLVGAAAFVNSSGGSGRRRRR